MHNFVMLDPGMTVLNPTCHVTSKFRWATQFGKGCRADCAGTVKIIITFIISDKPIIIIIIIIIMVVISDKPIIVIIYNYYITI
jgi:hypothetical protein